MLIKNIFIVGGQIIDCLFLLEIQLEQIYNLVGTRKNYIFDNQQKGCDFMKRQLKCYIYTRVSTSMQVDGDKGFLDYTILNI